MAVFSLLGLAVPGKVPGEIGGWLLRPLEAMVRYLAQSWRPVLVRSLVLRGLWAWSERWGPAWLRLVPWALWL